MCLSCRSLSDFSSLLQTLASSTAVAMVVAALARTKLHCTDSNSPAPVTRKPRRGGAPIGAGGHSPPPTFLHRGGQGVHKLMTIILHVFKHVMYFFQPFITPYQYSSTQSTDLISGSLVTLDRLPFQEDIMFCLLIQSALSARDDVKLIYIGSVSRVPGYVQSKCYEYAYTS